MEDVEININSRAIGYNKTKHLPPFGHPLQRGNREMS
jgi:hypothetical protein